MTKIDRTALRVSARTAFALVGITLLFSLTFSIASCRKKPLAQGLVVSDHDTRFSIEIGDRPRDGTIHVPPLYDGTKPQSLLFALHGGGQTGEFFSGFGFERLADDLGFIIVYPNGIGRRWDSPDDVVFFETLVREFKKQYNIDPKRIYATGHSAGAIEAYELAARSPGLFSAIAPVAGTVIVGTPSEDALPVSVLHVHTKDDPEVPFDGVWDWGISPASESINFWRRINGGFGIPVPDSVPMPKEAYERAKEIFCDEHGMLGTVWHGKGADTASLIYNVGGHVWPQRATETIMDFFYNHPARGNRVMIEREGLPITAFTGDVVALRPVIDFPRAVSRVAFYSNAALIGETTKPPFSLDWKISTAGLNLLRAEATLKNGETIRSTLNPFVLGVTPIDGAKTGTHATASVIPIISDKSSSNEAADIEAPCAIDGNFYTRWSSDWTDSESLTLDLGEARRVNGVTIFWEIAWGKAYCIELSTDGKTWQRAVYQDDGKGGIETYGFPPTRARYVRFSGVKRGTEWGYSFWEIFVHGE